MSFILSATLKSFGVRSPFLHHFLKASWACALLMEKGMTLSGARLPTRRSLITIPAPQKLHLVAVVCVSVINTAPQFLQLYSVASPSLRVGWCVGSSSFVGSS